LTDLVEQGVVDLPTIERRIDLGRALPASEQRALRARIDAAAEATLSRSGCAATWEMADPRTLRVLFTPLSDQDARGIAAPSRAFARECAPPLSSRTETKAAVSAPPEPEPIPPLAPSPKRKAKEALAVAPAPPETPKPAPQAPAPAQAPAKRSTKP